MMTSFRSEAYVRRALERIALADAGLLTTFHQKLNSQRDFNTELIDLTFGSEPDR